MSISYKSIKKCIPFLNNRNIRMTALLFIAASGTACQARAKLIISDISSDARALDISIWKHRRISDSDKFELIPSNPTPVFTSKDQIPKYRINVEIDHNVEYTIFAATFIPKPNSQTELCLQDISSRIELNGLSLLEAIADVSVPVHPVRGDGVYPSSSCLARPGDGGLWPSRKPLIAQLSLSSNSPIGDPSTAADMAVSAPMDMGMGMGMGGGGGPPDLGDSCSSSSGLPDGVNAPPGTLALDGWLLDPSTKLTVRYANKTGCAPIVDNAAPSSPDAQRLVVPLTSDQIGKLRRQTLELSVTNSSGQVATVQSVL